MSAAEVGTFAIALRFLDLKTKIQKTVICLEHLLSVAKTLDLEVRSR